MVFGTSVKKRTGEKKEHFYNMAINLNNPSSILSTTGITYNDKKFYIGTVSSFQQNFSKLSATEKAKFNNAITFIGDADSSVGGLSIMVMMAKSATDTPTPYYFTMGNGSSGSGSVGNIFLTVHNDDDEYSREQFTFNRALNGYNLDATNLLSNVFLKKSDWKDAFVSEGKVISVVKATDGLFYDKNDCTYSSGKYTPKSGVDAIDDSEVNEASKYIRFTIRVERDRGEDYRTYIVYEEGNNANFDLSHVGQEFELVGETDFTYNDLPLYEWEYEYWSTSGTSRQYAYTTTLKGMHVAAYSPLNNQYYMPQLNDNNYEDLSETATVSVYDENVTNEYIYVKLGDLISDTAVITTTEKTSSQIYGDYAYSFPYTEFTMSDGIVDNNVIAQWETLDCAWGFLRNPIKKGAPKKITFHIDSHCLAKVIAMDTTYMVSDGYVINVAAGDNVQITCIPDVGYYCQVVVPGISTPYNFAMPKENIDITVSSKESKPYFSDTAGVTDITVLSISDSICQRIPTNISPSTEVVRTPCNSVINILEKGYMEEEFTDEDLIMPSFDTTNPYNGNSIALHTIYPNIWFKVQSVINGVVIGYVQVIPCYYSKELDKYVPMISAGSDTYRDVTRFDMTSKNTSQRTTHEVREFNYDTPFTHQMSWYYDDSGNVLCNYIFEPELIYSDKSNQELERRCLPERFAIIPYNYNEEPGETLFIDVNYENINALDDRHSPLDRMYLTSLTPDDNNNSFVQPLLGIVNKSEASVNYDSIDAEYDGSIGILKLGNLSKLASSVSVLDNFDVKSGDIGYAFKIRVPSWNHDIPIYLNIAYGRLALKRGSNDRLLEIDKFDANSFDKNDELGVSGNLITLKISADIEDRLNYLDKIPYSIKFIDEDDTPRYDVVINLSLMIRMGLISNLSDMNFYNQDVSLYVSFVRGWQYIAICSSKQNNISNFTGYRLLDEIIKDSDSLYTATTNTDRGDVVDVDNTNEAFSADSMNPNF